MEVLRLANAEDSEGIAQVLGEIFNQYTEDEEKKREIVHALTRLVKESNNAISYKYCHVHEMDHTIAGVLSHYPAEQDHALILPIDRLLNELLTEEQPSEHEIAVSYNDQIKQAEGYYISMLAVLPQHRGQSIGSKLVCAVEELAKEQGYEKISIKTDVNNPNAQKLYEKIGYEFVKTTTTSDGVSLNCLEKRL